MSPTRAAVSLNHRKHSPRVFFDNHSPEVDIWGVGKLIVDARELVLGLKAEAVAFVEGLLNMTETSAEQVLAAWRSLFVTSSQWSY